MDTQHKIPVKPQLKKPVKPQPKTKTQSKEEVQASKTEVQASKVELTKQVEVENKIDVENNEAIVNIPKENYNNAENEFVQQNNQANQTQGSLLDFARQENANDENIKKQIKEKRALNLKKSKKFIIIGASAGLIIVMIAVAIVLKTTGVISPNNKKIANTTDENASQNDSGTSLERIKKELAENGYEVGESSIDSEVDTLTIPSNIAADDKKVEEFKEAYKKAREEEQLDPSDAYIEVVKKITGTSVNLDPNNRYNPDAPELTIQGSNGGANSSMEGKGKSSDN